MRQVEASGADSPAFLISGFSSKVTAAAGSTSSTVRRSSCLSQRIAQKGVRHTGMGNRGLSPVQVDAVAESLNAWTRELLPGLGQGAPRTPSVEDVRSDACPAPLPLSDEEPPSEELLAEEETGLDNWLSDMWDEIERRAPAPEGSLGAEAAERVPSRPSGCARIELGPLPRVDRRREGGSVRRSSGAGVLNPQACFRFRLNRKKERTNLLQRSACAL